MAHSGSIKKIDRPEFSSFGAELLRNLLVSLSVSFVALSLGAAFGILSGRGTFYGMLSAGIIAFIAAALGGTRVQCSGPVAPTAAIMAGIVVMAESGFANNPNILGGMTPDHFLNLICMLCGIVMVTMALLRTGKFISYVPEQVVSGFMTGVALIIWVSQAQVLWGLDKAPLKGDMLINSAVAFGTLALTFIAFPILNRISKTAAKILPSTLVALLVMVAISIILGLDIEKVRFRVEIHSLKDVWTLIENQFPRNVSLEALRKALPYGFEFALISYLDSLMVALIVDRLTGEKSNLNKELVAQGVANAAVGFVGGIPGTQASIRSVMMVKEGATMRLAGMMVGVFVFIEMLILTDFIQMIPKAVFAGILIKVGWNVCDKEPIWAFIRRAKKAPPVLEFFILIGTALVTVWNLSAAVVFFTLFYYTAKYWQGSRIKPQAPIPEQVRQSLNADEAQ